MAKAVGIDTGATNSVVAVMECGKPTVVINAVEIYSWPRLRATPVIDVR
jgi:molecular chaperone DnaK (HSP70)